MTVDVGSEHIDCHKGGSEDLNISRILDSSSRIGYKAATTPVWFYHHNTPVSITHSYYLNIKSKYANNANLSGDDN